MFSCIQNFKISKVTSNSPVYIRLATIIWKKKKKKNE